jgi:hypothetical protein
MKWVPAIFAYISTILLFLASFTVPVQACEKDPECSDPSAWAGFTRMELKQSMSSSTEAVEWSALFDHQTKDILIETKFINSNSPINGKISLVNGLIMITKDMELRPGYEIDAIDAPVLSMKLVMIILSRIYPNGPIDVTDSKTIDYSDNTGIKYATPSASGYIPAPWQAKGSIHKDINGNIDYKLQLTFQIDSKDGKTENYSINMNGMLGMHGSPIFQDSDLLEGWKTYGLGPRQFKQGSSTILDYGAKPEDSNDYRNIGDIRAYIAAENHPGHIDVSKDFTGFWKEKCEQAFGLQIKHYGEDGKYSVVFCGPGGCGDPAESRLTYITGDKRWKVVSEDDLVQVGSTGKNDTYHRCTKDTNPVLKYKKQ